MANKTSKTQITADSFRIIESCLTAEANRLSSDQHELMKKQGKTEEEITKLVQTTALLVRVQHARSEFIEMNSRD